MITSVVMVQYQLAFYFLKGPAVMTAGRSPATLLQIPIVYGILFGAGFGVYENICYPQVLNRPAKK